MVVVVVLHVHVDWLQTPQLRCGTVAVPLAQQWIAISCKRRLSQGGNIWRSWAGLMSSLSASCTALMYPRASIADIGRMSVVPYWTELSLTVDANVEVVARVLHLKVAQVRAGGDHLQCRVAMGDHAQRCQEQP